MSFEIIKSLKRLSFINAENGIEIYQRNFESSFFLKHDDQLVSAFISALLQFSKEIVKDEMQEIIFANSQLILKRFDHVIILVLTSLNINKQTISAFINRLGKQVESEFQNKARIRTISPNLVKSIKKAVDTYIEQEIIKPMSLPHFEGTQKIIIAGLRKVGKTTSIRKFFHSWDNEQLKGIIPTIDYSIYNSFLDVLRANLTLFDLGGQERYIEQHLTQETKWKSAAAILFMVDIQDLESFQEANNYLNKIINIVKTQKQIPFIGIFAHKFDPDKINQLQPNLNAFLRIFKGISDWPRYSFFMTSIYDDSLHLAFMRTLIRIVPRKLIQNILESAIFFETQNEIWNTVSQRIDKDLQGFQEKIISLAIPYGEKFANDIFKSWISQDIERTLEKPRGIPLDVEVIEIQDGFRIIVELKKLLKEENFPVITAVIEGLLTGLGNVFGLSTIERDEVIKETEKLSMSWNLYES